LAAREIPDIDYDRIRRNAPLTATHAIIIKTQDGSIMPWYVLEDQNYQEYLKHFDSRIIIAFAVR